MQTPIKYTYISSNRLTVRHQPDTVQENGLSPVSIVTEDRATYESQIFTPPENVHISSSSAKDYVPCFRLTNM